MTSAKLYAGFLGLLFPGLGHFYHKRYVSTAVMIGVYFLLYPVGFYFMLTFINSSLILGFITLLGLTHVLSAVFAYRLTLKDSHSWYIVIGFFFLSSALYTLIDYNMPFKNFTIPSRSMENTLHVGDQVSVIKTQKIKRGDISVFTYLKKGEETFFIKRCVAVGGDKVMLLNKHFYLHPHEGDSFIKMHYEQSQIVHMDGLLWAKNPYMHLSNTIWHDKSVQNTQHIQRKKVFDMEVVTVAHNRFFMLGDNRDHSNDSRFIGSIPKEDIFGKAYVIYLNYNDFSRVGKRIK